MAVLPKPGVIIQDTDAPELLASAIIEVAAAAKKLLNGPLTRRAVVVLIRDAIPGRVSLADIEAVLSAAARLDRYVVKPQQKQVPKL